MLGSLRLKTYERALKAGHFGIASLVGSARSSAQEMLLPTTKYGTEKLLRKILHSGAKIDSAQLLVEARNSKTEPFEKMKTLIQSGLDPNGFVGPRRLKLLNFAILNRDKAFFDFLMNQKIDLHIADRNDLLPIQAAQMVEEKQFEQALKSSSDNAAHVLKIIESLVINENMLYSELHELLKWCFKNSGFDLVRTTLPQTNLLRYRIRNANTELRVELKFISSEEITLLLFKGEEVLPLQSLLPSSGRVDSKTLRGHVVTELKEFLRQAQNKSYQRETQNLFQDEKALQTLGFKTGASEKDIIAAYRTLAKRYHPDVSAKGSHNMIELNRAYETLRKK
jgi:hypothetical protein